MLFRGGRDHAPVLVDDQRASAAGADIDTEELDNSLLFARRFSIACRAEVVDQFCNLFARAGNVPITVSRVNGQRKGLRSLPSPRRRTAFAWRVRADSSCHHSHSSLDNLQRRRGAWATG